MVDVPNGVAELDGFGNVLFHCFDHEIVLEGMKEEISQQRSTIGAHGYTNNLPENRVLAVEFVLVRTGKNNLLQHASKTMLLKRRS